MTEEKVDGWTVTKCSSPECRARVIWTNTERGSRMLVDADPAPGGNFLLVEQGGRNAPPLAVKQPPHLIFGREDLRKSHFATCPRAAEHRRRKEKEQMEKARPRGTLPKARWPR